MMKRLLKNLGAMKVRVVVVDDVVRNIRPFCVSDEEGSEGDEEDVDEDDDEEEEDD